MVVVHELAGLFDHEEFRDRGNDEGEHHGRRDNEEDIGQWADLIFWGHKLRGRGGNTREQEVGDIQNQRGIKAGRRCRKGHHRAHDGGATHGVEGHCAQRDQDDVNGIRGHGAGHAGQCHHEGQHLGADLGHHRAHQRGKQARLLRHGHAEHHGKDDAERREAGEVLHCISNHARDILGGQQGFYFDGLAGLGVLSGHANEVPQPRGHSDYGCEDDEEPEWIRQLIANLFYSAQEAACRTWFFFSFGFGHCIGTSCRSVGTN